MYSTFMVFEFSLTSLGVTASLITNDAAYSLPSVSQRYLAGARHRAFWIEFDFFRI